MGTSSGSWSGSGSRTGSGSGNGKGGGGFGSGSGVGRGPTDIVISFIFRSIQHDHGGNRKNCQGDARDQEDIGPYDLRFPA